jgi:hypothetical protein
MIRVLGSEEESRVTHIEPSTFRLEVTVILAAHSHFRRFCLPLMNKLKKQYFHLKDSPTATVHDFNYIHLN